MRVLCVAAHPDDEILGVGGTLLRHLDDGDDVEAIILHTCRPETITERAEAERRLGFPTSIREGIDLDVFIRSRQPDIVYTHSSADLHADHRSVHERVLVATRPGSGVTDVYAFETPSATDWGVRPFTPQLFVDISSTFDRKLDAMDAYESELRDWPHPRNLGSLHNRAGYWGQRIGGVAAEAFEVIRESW